MNKQIAVIGECMIEIKPHAAIGYGGDTLNFSVYLSRMGISVSYVTALGDDHMSDWILSQWRYEGIHCELVKRQADSLPGLYLIDVDESGERTFYYWRDQSPARHLLDQPAEAQQLFDELTEFDNLYLSGITLAIYTTSVRQRLFEFLDRYRAQGGRVLFDNNYRPRQWQDKAEAQYAFEQMYRRTDIALPTIDDELLLFDDTGAEDIIARLKSWGVPEVVLKRGAEGCTIATDTVTKHIPANKVVTVVDTTAAGDSFNAGFVAARFKGQSCKDSAANGNRLAALVVQHRGAIIPKNLMADFLE